MARSVGDYELAPRRGEVPISDVDGYALLTFRAQPIGQEGEVGVLVTALLARALDRFELVSEDRLGVVEQTSD
jgi:hypothetical protein